MSKNYYIYQIVCGCGEVYIGRTVNPKRRKIRHKWNCKHDIKIPLYRHINGCQGWGACKFEILFESDYQPREAEQRHIDMFGALNVKGTLDSRAYVFCLCGNKYLKCAKKAHERSLVHQRYIGNEIKPTTCECGGIYVASKIKHEQSQKHKDYINNIKRELKDGQIQCGCTGVYTIKHKSDHEKTQIHQNYLIKK